MAEPFVINCAITHHSSLIIEHPSWPSPLSLHTVRSVVSTPRPLDACSLPTPHCRPLPLAQPEVDRSRRLSACHTRIASPPRLAYTDRVASPQTIASSSSGVRSSALQSGEWSAITTSERRVASRPITTRRPLGDGPTGHPLPPRYRPLCRAHSSAHSDSSAQRLETSPLLAMYGSRVSPVCHAWIARLIRRAMFPKEFLYGIDDGFW